MVLCSSKERMFKKKNPSWDKKLRRQFDSITVQCCWGGTIKRYMYFSSLRSVAVGLTFPEVLYFSSLGDVKEMFNVYNSLSFLKVFQKKTGVLFMVVVKY